MPTYGKGYIKTPTGILKIIEIILCIVVVALVSEYTEGYYSGGDDLFPAIMGAGVCGLVVSLLIFVLSCAAGSDVDSVLEWQCVFHFLMTVWFLVTGIMLCIKNYGNKSLTIAIIAIVTGVVYLLDAIFSYKDYKPF